jgi:5-methylcytosine-specific restriction endonuclease McrA
VKHTIHFKDIPANCYAAAVLLHQVYTVLERKAWNKARRSFLDVEFKKHGTLTCHYCHRTDLKKKDKQSHNVATVDHVIAKSNGGNELSHANFVVACNTCNRKKSNQSVDKFITSNYLAGKRK